VQYIDKIRAAKHAMRWEYQTNSFLGCHCGSRGFAFKCHREERTVEVVLECTRCGELWMNLWEDEHPISKLKTMVHDPGKTRAEVEDTLDTAEKKIEGFLENKLSAILESGRS
ncbi:MAG: hypothetical protein RDV41_01060, partial [Planctomycetota bacterium]|nr:hypothetical protein [Planctomycetota bacterium]